MALPIPNQDHTAPPLKRHKQEANPLPEEQPAESDATATPETQSKVEIYDEIFEEGTHALPTTPKLSTPAPTVCNSRWNPEHPNLFTFLEEQLDFDGPILAEDNPRYNIVTVETTPESPANQNNTSNSIELDLEIHNEFPTNNYEPKEETSFLRNVMSDIPQINNVYKGETKDVYTNTPMDTSPLIEKESIANPPMETSSLIYLDSTADSPMETTPEEVSEATLNSPMDTFNTPAEMGLVDNNKSHLSNEVQSSTINDNPKHAIAGIYRHPPDVLNLKAEKLVEGISIDKLFAETAEGRTLLGKHWSPENGRNRKQTNDPRHPRWRRL
ncbi:hypothetical protein DSO57_1003230 [Entomophthora muscae]|uniref:Uncharacterized protein n=1 Tax=Entomophthora muscae TaxID=34485 RepID=A0ACC2TWB5_9FUNG|nr:hypothetical protein DSO57_1003230 [Entomophthora muscae]